eukprot:3536836-Amphidinium_carterae.1
MGRWWSIPSGFLNSTCMHVALSCHGYVGSYRNLYLFMSLLGRSRPLQLVPSTREPAYKQPNL